MWNKQNRIGKEIQYEVLGGYREYGEQMDMTAKRELQEETGAVGSIV